MGDFDFLQGLAPPHAPTLVREAARSRLRAAIAAEQGRRRGAWRRKATAFALAAIAVVAAAVGWVLLQAPPSAQAALERLATAVERIPPAEFPPGALLYTKSEQVSLAVLPGSELPQLGREQIALLLPRTREIWIAPEGSIRLRVTTGTPIFFDERTAQAFAQSDLASVLGVDATTVETHASCPECIDPTDWPTDPDQLEQAMRVELQGEPQDLPISVRLLDLAASLLRETGAQPDLRAAVLRVLAHTDGLTVDQPAESPLLQVSAGYQDESGRWTRTIGFDAYGNLITDTLTTLDGIPSAGVPANTNINQAVYQPTTIVDQPTD
jgi:hypothetical protein